MKYITLVLLIAAQMTFFAQNTEPENTSNKDLLLGKWINRNITYRKDGTKSQQVMEHPKLNNYFYEFTDDNGFTANLFEGRKSGTWIISEDLKKITFNVFDPKDKNKIKKSYSYTVVKLTESELRILIPNSEGSTEHLYTKFDPNRKHKTVALKFYNSFHDFSDDKFVKSYDVTQWSDSDFSSEYIKYITEEGQEEKLKTADFPTDFYMYGENTLYRRYKNESYKIIVGGEFCYYSVNFPSQDPERYSETISGPIKKFNDGVLKDKLKDHNLLEAYKRDKPRREFKDNVQDYFDKEVARTIKYVRLLNAKLAKQQGVNKSKGK
ncbi:MAG: hypothetical protein KBC56_00310 [Flavobacterium sp.]|nr:hypothetical protein [Flavobacterium sp.]